MKKEHQDKLSAEIHSLKYGQKETHDFKFIHNLSPETTLILNNQCRMMSVFEMVLKAILEEESEEEANAKD